MPDKNSRMTWLATAGVAVAMLTLVVFFRSRPQDGLVGDRNRREDRPTRDQFIEIGGVRRPITDVKPFKPRSDPKEAPTVPDAGAIGTTPPVKADANPQVVSVAEALKSGKHPERLTSLIVPQPFDQKKYESEPQAYLNIAEPGRIWQVAQPGKDVPRLIYRSERYQEAEQGQGVRLKVQAIKNAPVTFTSFDLGAFQNQLTTVTVKANEDGLAQATFTGTPGTIGAVNILAGSPMTSGQLKFQVNVLLPKKTAPLATQKANAN